MSFMMKIYYLKIFFIILLNFFSEKFQTYRRVEKIDYDIFHQNEQLIIFTIFVF